MWENIDIDRHYTGVFQILGEPISGELIYNKQNGTILLNLIKEASSESFFGKSYGTQPVITGKLNTGAVVTLLIIGAVTTIHKHLAISTLFLFLNI